MKLQASNVFVFLRAVHSSASSSSLKKALSFEAMVWLFGDILRHLKMIFLSSGT